MNTDDNNDNNNDFIDSLQSIEDSLKRIEEGPVRKTQAIIMSATRLLQGKVGVGKISRDCINDAEFIIKQSKTTERLDEFIEPHLKEMKALMSDLKVDAQAEGITDKLAKSIMRFKGNVSMFSLSKLVELSIVMLRWIESIQEVDKDVLDVLNGYIVTLSQVESKSVKDDKLLNAIVVEMQAACERYFAKHPELELQAEITNKNAFYISEEKLNSKEDGYNKTISDEDLDKGLSDDSLIED